MSAPMKTTMLNLSPPSSSFPWTSARLNVSLLLGYLSSCVLRHVLYGLGAKADQGGRPLAAFPPQYISIDCSGFVRAAIAYATNSGLILPDGSVNQHAWCNMMRLKVSRFAALLLKDGAVRIAFIAPNRQHPIGHVFLCRNGKTMESYGGHGPGSRSPLVHVLHLLTTDVYVLTPPE